VLYAPRHATRFWLETAGGLEWLCVRPFLDAPDTLRYALCPQGTAIPAGADWIEVPASRLAVLSATHIGLLDAIGASEAIAGLSYPQYAYHAGIRERLAKGEVADIGQEGGLNLERLVAMRPQALVATGMSAVSFGQEYGLLREAGIPVWPNAEWLEPTVLGRAEWMVAMGALVGRRREAEEAFGRVAQAYEALREKASKAAARPKVIGGLPYQGTWSVAGGNSYVARLMADAGGDWPWANEAEAVSLPLDFESVYPIALEAPFWIRTGTARRLEELLAIDGRFGNFASMKRGQVYNYTKRMAPNGMGNDYWESGVARPDRLLADWVAILHPELLPGHELYYYEKLE
jgi:iron complex transport system substrate-binding protein